MTELMVRWRQRKYLSIGIDDDAVSSEIQSNTDDVLLGKLVDFDSRNHVLIFMLDIDESSSRNSMIEQRYMYNDIFPYFLSDHTFDGSTLYVEHRFLHQRFERFVPQQYVSRHLRL
jgi:hypothetical protein